jgi:hypothetical protein
MRLAGMYFEICLSCVAIKAITSTRFLRLPDLISTDAFQYTCFVVKTYDKARGCKWCYKRECGKWDSECHNWDEEQILYCGRKKAYFARFLHNLRELLQPLECLAAETVDLIRGYYHSDEEENCGYFHGDDLHHLHPLCEMWPNEQWRAETTADEIAQNSNMRVLITKTYTSERTEDEQDD